MRLVFMGTPRFAVPAFEKLLNSKHQVAAVVTAPDKPRGRGRVLSPTPIKEAALKANLPILQPANLKSTEFLKDLGEFEPDLNVVVAFRILPESVFALPRLGSINLHASLLPAYRGAAPINWAIINGETVTGLTTFLLQKEVDTGDIIMRREVTIRPEDDFGSVHDKMALIGADLLLESIDALESGRAMLIPQDRTQVSSAPKITPETRKIKWGRPAKEICNLIRGLSPHPGAYSVLDGRKLIILKGAIMENNRQAEPGTITIADDKSGLAVACGDGALHILQLKPEGKKVMGSAEFVRGYHVEAGKKFAG
ncbi:MAG: methionyl-tRNA formyltransferase [candidate division Zixibacteria bacterium]|nr:methionyl-tRNA formyltransferase [candidate division Zixibacteria bacterium]